MNFREEPEFIRDAAPYFAPSIACLGVHLSFVLTGNILHGAWIMLVLTPLYNMLWIGGRNNQNIVQKNEKAWTQSSMFLIPLYTYIATQTSVWIYTLLLFSDKYRPECWIFDQNRPTEPFQLFVFILTTGFFTGVSGTAAHELVHQKNTIHKFWGNWTYIIGMYTHFWDEHTMGHHRHLATPLDPVSHEVGANIYTGVPKAIAGTHIKAWEREVERLEKLNPTGKISLLENITGNRMHYYFAFNVSLCYAIYELLGYTALKWQLVYGFSSMMWLEFVNFLEHYGLRRRKDENGVYESVGYQHSWSAVASPIAFRIQRHSDHHAHKFRPYQILRRFDRAPTLPFEYILVLACAVCPPVFQYIMDPRVKSIEDAKNGIANPDAWNNQTPLSADDKVRFRNCKIYLGLIFGIMTFSIKYAQC